MIGIYNENINEIPSLIIVEESKKEEALPLFIYSHGFTSAKEHNLPIAYLLAESGYRVILPDSIYHGEREIENMSTKEKSFKFWNIVLKNIEELAVIKEYFAERNLILGDRIGLAGTSMGGITTAAALTTYDWIQVSAVLMGTPKMVQFSKELIASIEKSGSLPISEDELEVLYETLSHYDLSKQPEKLNDRPLLFWHGENDQLVPYYHSHEFYQEVNPLYENQSNIKFISEANQDHKVSRYAILETVNWFKKFL